MAGRRGHLRFRIDGKMSCLVKCAVSALCLGVFSPQMQAQTLIGPDLAVASNFSQGWRPDILEGTADVPVRDFRDTVHWSVVEKDGQRFDYRNWRAAFPGILRARDLKMSLFVNAFHPSYDGGDTAHTPKAVVAFGNYARQTVEHYPNIHSVEVGNEFNGEDFVKGPARTQDLEARAGYYVALLKSVYDQVKTANPAIRIVGGGVHSIPVGYLAMTYAEGAAAYMDALALHTYDTPAEHLLRQINVLRRLPEAETIPIEITEFGTLDAQDAPGYLLRNYCQMALAGVDRAVWYPMHPRGDGLIPVVDDTGAVTRTGRAYGFAQQEFTGKSVRRFQPDPFTYGCVFDNKKLVIWGAPRSLVVSNELQVFDPAGKPLPLEGLELSNNEPLVLIADHPLDVEADITLGQQTVLADSYHQLSYPDPNTPAPPSPWVNTIQANGAQFPFQTMPGQERQGVPWVPYLGHKDYADLRLSATYLVPTGQADAPIEVVQSYTADQPRAVGIDAYWQVSTDSEDGISVAIYLNDTLLFRTVTTDLLALKNRRVLMQAGDILAFHVGPNQTPWGDYTEHRIILTNAPPSNFLLLSDN